MTRYNKRSNKRAVLTTAICLSMTLGTSLGFTSAPSVQAGGPLHLRRKPSISANLDLSIATSTSALRMSSLPSLPRLTEEEEEELLRQVREMRRLTRMESDMAMQNYGEMPFLSIRSKAAGYGEDLDLYEDAISDGQNARETLVTRNMALVNYCVSEILKKKKNQRLNSLSREDLVQEGAIGLARAIDKYDPSIGGKLSTYAVYWIRAAIFRCIAERDDLLRVPNHVSQAISKINKAANRLGVDLDPSMASTSWKEAIEAKRVAEEAGLSEKNFREAMKARTRRYSGGYVAFESWMQKGQDLACDVPSNVDAEEKSPLETEQLRNTLSKFLRPKEMEALSWRYGLIQDQASNQYATPKERANQYLAQAEQELFGSETSVKAAATQVKAVPVKGRFGEAMSFNEVGSRMQVSAEYCRRLCHGALAKLQAAAEDGRLEPALLL